MLCLQETWTTQQTHLTRANAGTANVWRDSRMTSLQDGNHRIWVLEDPRTGIIIINSYLPPRGKYSNDAFRDEVDRLHEICEKFSDHPIILAGDVNVDLNKKHDSRTRYLAEFLKTHHLHEPITIKDPTFRQHSGNGCSKIDYIFINQKLKDNSHHIEYKIIEDKGLNTSSHLPLFMSLSYHCYSAIKTTGKEKATTKLQWEKCDAVTYTDTSQKCLDVQATCADPITAIEYLTKSLHTAATAAVPMRKPKRAPWCPDIPGAIRASKEAHYSWKNAGLTRNHTR